MKDEKNNGIEGNVRGVICKVIYDSNEGVVLVVEDEEKLIKDILSLIISTQQEKDSEISNLQTKNDRTREVNEEQDKHIRKLKEEVGRLKKEVNAYFGGKCNWAEGCCPEVQKQQEKIDDLVDEGMKGLACGVYYLNLKKEVKKLKEEVKELRIKKKQCGMCKFWDEYIEHNPKGDGIGYCENDKSNSLKSQTCTEFRVIV